MKGNKTLSPFDEHMRDANTLLGDGDYAGSAVLFNEALGAASTAPQRIEARQMQAIALSRDGKLEEAERQFGAAIKMAMHIHDYQLELRVERDLAMAWIDAAQRWRYMLQRQELLRKADVALYHCFNSLQAIGETEEAWVTLGFLGYHELVANGRYFALQSLRDADAGLSKFLKPNYDYILNNRMVLLRAVPRKERPTMKPGTLNLIEITGQAKRYDELRLIMLGGDGLYRFVRALPSWATRLIKRMFGS